MKLFRLAALFFSIISVSLFAQEVEYWGSTSSGGSGNGTIYRTDSEGNFISTVYEFESECGIRYNQPLEIDKNKYIGMSSCGGDYDRGYIYLFESDQLSIIYSFSGVESGSYPKGGLIRTSNGRFYGMTEKGGEFDLGIIFEFELASNSFEKKHDFSGTNGANPVANLLEATNGKLYGMTKLGGLNEVGVIFSYDPTTGVFSKKIDFNKNNTGSNPNSSLIEAIDGKIYGTTMNGGEFNNGVLFEFNIINESLNKIYDFKVFGDGGNPRGNLIFLNNKLYGLIRQWPNDVRILYEFDIDLGTLTHVKKWTFYEDPAYDIISDYDSLIFGVTTDGGRYKDYGTIFKYNIDNQSYKVLYDFNKNIDGSDPYNTPILSSDKVLIGVNSTGGTIGNGVLYSFNLSTVEYDVMHNFGIICQGNSPKGELLEASDGKIYGIAHAGGRFDYGVLFSIDPRNYEYQKLMEFDLKNYGGFYKNDDRYSSLIEVEKGLLYGITPDGGIYDGGVIFEYDIISKAFTVKKLFSSSTGDNPEGKLLKASNGKIYGTCKRGGANNQGTIFEYDFKNDILTKKIDFEGADNGNYPEGYLIEASNNLIYGTTSGGGINRDGTLFEYNFGTNELNKIFNFERDISGSGPIGIIENSNGKLFGLTSGGGVNGDGIIYEFDLSSKTFTKKLDFNDELNGWLPSGSLLEGIDGNLYGTTLWGGLPLQEESGVLFQYNLESNSIIKKFNFSKSIGRHPYNVTLIKYVTKKHQVLLFKDLETVTYGDDPILLECTSSSGLSVSFSSSDENIATIEGNQLIINGAGEVNISASQDGDEEYYAAETIVQILTINKANQEITFNIKDQIYLQDKSISLLASSSSGLSVDFLSSDPNIIAIEGNNGIIKNIGEVTISAVQNGNENFHAAQPVERMLLVETITDLAASEIIGVPYPNPTNGQIQINLDRQYSNLEVQILDVQGNQIGKDHLKNIKTVDFVFDYPAGIYFIRIYDEKQFIKTDKIVKL